VIAPVPIAAAAQAAAPAQVAPRPGAFSEVLQRQLVAPAPAAGTPTSAAAPLAGALSGLERARTALDRALAQARAGRTFSPQELLALQADAYRFSHAVEVASKVAEAGAQSVKQAVHTQV
jgi:hypothetical protein